MSDSVDDADARAARIMVQNSVSSFARWGYWLLGALLGLALIGSLYACIRQGAPPSDDDEREAPYALATLAGLIPLVALRLLRPVFGARAVAREQAFLGRRLFRVDGYFEAIGSSATEGTATLTVRFRTGEALVENRHASFRAPARRTTHGAPDDETLRAALAGCGGTVVGTHLEGTKRIAWSVDFGETSVSTNAHLAAWFRRVIAALERLHPDHPVEAVHCEGFRVG